MDIAASRLVQTDSARRAAEWISRHEKGLILESLCIVEKGAHVASRSEKIMQKDVNQTAIDEKVTKKKLDMELDRELEATFPASDALKITRADIRTRFSKRNCRM